MRVQEKLPVVLLVSQFRFLFRRLRFLYTSLIDKEFTENGGEKGKSNQAIIQSILSQATFKHFLMTNLLYFAGVDKYTAFMETALPVLNCQILSMFVPIESCSSLL